MKTLLISKFVGALLITIGVCSAQTEENILYGGRFEVRGFGGANYGPSRSTALTPQTPLTFGGEVGFGLTDMMAVIGTFAYNRVGTDPSVNPPVDGSIKEYMGGMRFSVPIRDARIVPYGSLSLGKVSFKNYVEGTPNSQGVSTPMATSSGHVGIAPALGADIPFSKHVGVGIEFRVVKATDAGLYLRLCGSVFFRFP